MVSKAELTEKAELADAEVEALVAAPNRPLWCDACVRTCLIVNYTTVYGTVRAQS
jgi:hypothetical protein